MTTLPTSVQLLIKELEKSKFNPIPPKQLASEVELVRLVQEHQDKDALDRLVNSNMRFVVSRAKHFAAMTSIHFMDLVQVGTFGLIKAIGRYDSSPGYRLLSYARHWIDQSIQQFLESEGKVTIIDPSVTFDNINESAKEVGEDPTVTTLAREDFRQHCCVLFFHVLSLREYVTMKLYYGLMK